MLVLPHTMRRACSPDGSCQLVHAGVPKSPAIRAASWSRASCLQAGTTAAVAGLGGLSWMHGTSLVLIHVTTRSHTQLPTTLPHGAGLPEEKRIARTGIERGYVAIALAVVVQRTKMR